MKTLGLIGGMTWHSTLEYYRLINEGVQRRLGGAHSADLVLVSVDFGPIEKMQDRGDWVGMGRLMAGAARRLEAGGAQGLVICANTMHRLADDITQAVSIPVLHIADAAGAEIKRQGLCRVGLLGTRHTMEMDFYRERLERVHGLSIIIPEKEGRKIVNDIIYEELGHGVIREESRGAYVSVIDDLRKRGAEGVILGCTEIPLLIRPRDVNIPVFDTTALHAAAAVNFLVS